ncbi:unnamed protein product [Phaedon cochleariae]|uniref:Uncharacterized protein n=1 Tax=Phaedon cochleariae TaxID=80249 RepID=A0A9N9X3N4_PHACE|nr:unnamed protein product [Phaedon cochleariae]
MENPRSKFKLLLKQAMTEAKGKVELRKNIDFLSEKENHPQNYEGIFHPPPVVDTPPVVDNSNSSAIFSKGIPQEKPEHTVVTELDNNSETNDGCGISSDVLQVMDESNMNVQEESDGSFQDFSSDDSVKDPMYKRDNTSSSSSSASSTNSSSSSESSSEEEIEDERDRERHSERDEERDRERYSERDEESGAERDEERGAEEDEERGAERDEERGAERDGERGNIIFDAVDFSEEERVQLENIINDIDKSVILTADDQDSFKTVANKLQNQLQKLENNGPTAKLWILYFRMVTLLKQFIEAERTGNWTLHLETIQKMLPFFHASGHFFYAKSCHLYLQDMLNLQDKMDPTEFESFTTKGYFTIRRSDKFWSGIWTDMTIEQTLMRTMKSIGGLTHGRGITDSVLTKWTLGMTFLHNVCDVIEDFCGIFSGTTEQHVDMRRSRILRDSKDTEKLINWFNQHYPFPKIDNIMSISSGLVGDERVNCCNAQDIGSIGISNIIGKDFDSVKFKRKDRVIPLGAINNSITIEEVAVPIDPLLIFHRMCIAKKTDEELQQYLEYELAPFPLSLFSEEGMRKGTKSSLYKAFTPLPSDVQFENKVHVIDGGFLLHRVVWQCNESFVSICTNGCDTTSAIFNQGKNKFLKIIMKFPELNEIIEVFKDESADANAIAVAGENFLIKLYGVSQKDSSLDFLRYQQFSRSATKSKFNLASLPPTAAAAKQHSFRTYHQVQAWYGVEKNPEEWGWKRSKVGLTPVRTTKDPAPEVLLKFISCKCKKGCVSVCSCRKAGLNCSIICMYCTGNSCENIANMLIDSDDEDPDDIILLPTFDVIDVDSGEDESDAEDTYKISVVLYILIAKSKAPAKAFKLGLERSYLRGFKADSMYRVPSLISSLTVEVPGGVVVGNSACLKVSM